MSSIAWFDCTFLPFRSNVIMREVMDPIRRPGLVAGVTVYVMMCDRFTLKLFQENSAGVLHCFSISPDFNPIEHV